MNALNIAKLFTPPIVVACARSVLRATRAPRREPDVSFLLPTRAINDILPGVEDVEVNLSTRLLRQHLWAIPEHELIVLGAVCRMLQPRCVLEFGTFTGGSTLVMATNTPPDARIITVDIEPSQRAAHRHGLGEGLLEFDTGATFHGTAYESKIRQHFADTANFSMPDLKGTVDLVFVDADHTYSFVKRDTERALEYLRPGGAIVWHDYTWEPEHAECAGVTRCVNEFFEAHGNCCQIAGTRFAIYIDA